MKCPECQNMLSEYERRELGPSESARVAEHVRSCARCAKKLEALHCLDDLVRAVPTASPSAAALLEVRARVHGEAAGGEILDADQVAAYLGLSREDVLQSLDDLPCFEVAGQIRFRRSALSAWIEEQEQQHRHDVMLRRLVTRFTIDDRPFGRMVHLGADRGREV